MILRKVRDQPRTTREDLVNDLKRAGTTVSTVTISNTTPSWIKILQHAQGPPAQASTRPGPSEVCQNHLDDPEEAWEKFMWSDETKI